MARLNKTPLTLRVRRGTAAQITATSPAPYQKEGELAYATDTGGFYISNGTQFVLYTGALTAVDRIIAGTNISISPIEGTGEVTINATTLNPDPTGYGSFYSNVTQTLAAANTPQAVTLGQTYEAVGTSTSGSRIYMDKAGTYQFSYVAQVANDANSQEYAEFWIKYNGVEYPNSNTKMILQPRKGAGNPSEQLMTLIISGTSLNDNDYIELFWEATSTQVTLKYDPANASYPATPSIIANIIPIGAQGRDSNLNELNDVLITTPSTGQLLRRDSDGLWKNWTPNFLTTVPTLDQVTTAENTTTNAITVGGLTVDTNTLYVDPVNNRVGIGTTSPSQSLTISQSTGSTPFGGVVALIENTSSVGEAAITIRNQSFYAAFEIFGSGFNIAGIRNTALFTTQNGITNLGFATLGAANISFRTNSTGATNERLTIQGSSGNVGINTTTDAGYKLDVNGTFRATGNADFSGDIDANEIRVKGTVFARNIADVYTIADGALESFNIAGYTLLRAGGQAGLYLENGFGGPNKAGIWTSTPQATLDVNGTFRALLTNAIHSSAVYYNTTTGELTYGALPTFTETDPIFTASPSFGITSTNISNWNTAYGWGNHATVGYLTAESDTLDSVTGRGNTTTNAIAVGAITGTSLKVTSNTVQTSEFIHQDASNQTAFARAYFRVGNTTSSVTNVGLYVSPNLSTDNNVFLGISTTPNVKQTNSKQILFYLNTAGDFSLLSTLAENANSTKRNFYLGGSRIDAAGNPTLTLSSGSNVLIGTTTDAGFKLDVIGGTRFNGSVRIDNGSFQVAGGIKAELAQGTGNRMMFYNSVSQILTFDEYVPAIYITNTQITNWDTAYSWGNHATAGYLTSQPWVVSGSNIYYNTGNVLVGTTTDSGYKFDVNGTVRVVNKLTASGGLDVVGSATVKNYGSSTFIVQETQNNNAVWIKPQWYSADTSMYFSSEWFSFKYNATVGGFGYGNIITMRNNGNVMIGGAQDNGFKLEVSGTFRSTGAAQVATSTGGLGVGTTSPGYKLDVNGNGRFVGDLFANAALTVGGSVTASGNIQTNGASNKYVRAGGFISNALGQLANFGGADAGYYFVSGGGMQFVSAGGNRMLLNSAGNLLINTTTDSGYKLDVNGTGRFNGSLTILSSSPERLIVGGSASAIVKIGTNNSAGPHGIQFDYNSEIASDGMSVYYRTTPQAIFFEDSSGTSGNKVLSVFKSGSVSVGTDIDNGYKLDVNGDAQINGVIVGLGGGYITTNTLVGANSFVANTTGTYNTVVGYNLALGTSTGNNSILLGANSFLGSQTLERVIAISNNSFLDAATTVGTDNIFIGHGITNTGQSIGSNNIMLGHNQASLGAYGSNSIAIGNNLGGGNLGNLKDSIIIGHGSTGRAYAEAGIAIGNSITVWAGSVGIGGSASSGASVVIGYNSSASGEGSIAIGRYSRALSSNIQIGYNSGRFQGNPTENVAIGNGTLYANSGSGHTALGNLALGSSTVNGNNTAIGKQSLRYTSSGSTNTALGSESGLNNSTGSGNVFIGYQAGRDATTDSNKLYIANSVTNTLIYGDFSTGNISIGSTVDDGINKLQVAGNVIATSFIKSGGTASQFLKADGSVDSNSYVTFQPWVANGSNIYYSSGSVGIGTTAPTKLLTIQNNVPTVEIRSNAENQSAFLFFGTPFAGVAPPKAAIIAEAENTWSRSKLHFCLENTTNNSAAAEVNLTHSRMVITKEGRVGIGTTGPGFTLDVNGTGRFSGNVAIGDGLIPTAPWYGTIVLGKSGTDKIISGYLASSTNGAIIGGHSSALNAWADLNIAGTNLIFRSGETEYMRLTSAGNVGIGTTVPLKKLHVAGDVFIKGSASTTATKIFEVQNSNATSIMDFRGDTYAFFGCGQGGGSASGFIFRYSDTNATQFTGYNYGNGTSPSYKPILMDSDVVGRNQGIYINYGSVGQTNPFPTDTEFAVRGKAATYVAKFDSSGVNPLLYVKENGNILIGTNTDNGLAKLQVQGQVSADAYVAAGQQGLTISIPTGAGQTLNFTGGILTSVT